MGSFVVWSVAIQGERVRENLRQKKVSLFTLFMTVTETGT